MTANALNTLKRSHESGTPLALRLSHPFRGESVRVSADERATDRPEEKETPVERRQIIPQSYPLFLATAVEGSKTIIVRRVIAWQVTTGDFHSDELVPLVATRGKLHPAQAADKPKLLHHYSDSAHEAQIGLSRLMESAEGKP